MPKTIRKLMHEKLFSCGLSDDHCKAVIQAASESEILDSMDGRWDDDVSDYPLTLMSVTWASLAHVATEWLTTNAPKHWALGVFRSMAQPGA